jgi:hypothetical protein
MPGPFRFKLQPGDSEPAEISVVFSDEEYAVLDNYLQQCDEFTQCKPFREGFASCFSVRGTAGQPLKVEVTLPSKDDMAILLHRLRPLLLARELASFVRAVSTLGRRIEHPDFRTLLSEQRQRYDGRELQKIVTIALNETILNSERVLQDWLNSYEYHGDRAKRESIDTLFRQLPPDLLSGIFTDLLVGKINAIGSVRQIIATILAKTKGGRFGNWVLFTDAL